MFLILIQLCFTKHCYYKEKLDADLSQYGTLPRIWNPHRGIQNPRLSLNKLNMGREIEEKRRYFYKNVTCRGTEKDAGRGTEVMEIEDFSSFAIFVTVLLSLVAIIAIPGNGLVLGIIVRF